MNNLFLIFYLFVSIIHLIFCYNNNTNGRTLTKPFLMPLLLLYIIYTYPNTSLLVIAAIFFGFLGDVFLILDKSKLFFVLGLTAFLIGHICYSIALLEKITLIPNTTTILFIIFFLLTLAFIAYKSLYKYLNEMKAPVLLYFLVIITMVLCSSIYFTSNNTIQSFLAFTGALCFMLSDYILARSIFIKSFKLKNFIVMFTYIIAQFLLSISLV